MLEGNRVGTESAADAEEFVNGVAAGTDEGHW
jgi:hypothetical protein